MSIQSPEAGADGVRVQAALLRALLDLVEQVAPRRVEESLREQVVEEVARLGRRLLEAAAAMTPASNKRGSDAVEAVPLERQGA